MDHINANANMAHLCRLQERWEEATQHYKAVLARRPGNPVLLVNLAQVLQQLGSTKDIQVCVCVCPISLCVCA